MKTEFERMSNFATISRHRITLAINSEILEAKSCDARRNSRKREVLALHHGNADTLQRMINALEPGSYIRPHRHHAPPKPESLVLLRGSLAFIPFLEGGTPDHDHSVFLHHTHGAIALDCRESIWHTLIALESGTVFYEAKSGPFDAGTDKEYAAWAPSEDSPEAVSYLEGLVAGFRSHWR